MRKRSTEILEKLILSNSKSMEVKKLITTYRISLKTLRTDVNEINDFLLEAKMSPTKLNEKEKLILLEKDIMKTQDRLNHMDTYSYKMSREERQAAYNCDITYITNNELGFDYLRDNMVVRENQLVQRLSLIHI